MENPVVWSDQLKFKLNLPYIHFSLYTNHL